MIRLVVGLGNPGKEHERTRHNAGFWLVERFAVGKGIHFKNDPKYQALVARLETEGGNAGAWLLMPQSYMNASGRAVQMLAGFFKIKPEEILVVHDELDFPPGTARIKQGGGIAGHNGLKDISQRLGAHDYWRLRLGVGKPPPGTEGGDYVLQKPPAEEREAIDASIENALGVLPQILAGDVQGAMQKLHSQDKAVVKKEPVKKKEPEKKAAAPKKEKQPEAPAKKPEAKKPEAEKTGFLKSLFGKK